MVIKEQLGENEGAFGPENKMADEKEKKKKEEETFWQAGERESEANQEDRCQNKSDSRPWNFG